MKNSSHLAHLISFENANMMKVYKEIRKELEKYDKKLNLGEDGLSKKPEIIILTKADVISEQGESSLKFRVSGGVLEVRAHSNVIILADIVKE